MGLGYMVLSPEVFSLPHPYSWPPTPIANDDVDPAAICAAERLAVRGEESRPCWIGWRRMGG